MRHIASFRHFLSTGVLGPLSLGMDLASVARMIGPPQAFGALGSDDPLPLCWRYENEGSLLEIDFLRTPPHSVERLRLDPSLRGEFCLFGPNLLMTTDGIVGGAPPSAFLRGGAVDAAAAMVHLTETLDVTIVFQHVRIRFEGGEDFAESLDMESKQAIFADFGAALDFTEIDRCLGAADFLAGSDTACPERVVTRASCSTQTYLAMLATSETPTDDRS